MNRREELLTEEGEEVGDGSAERLSAIGDGGQAEFHSYVTLMAQVLVPCWIQFYLLFSHSVVSDSLQPNGMQHEYYSQLGSSSLSPHDSHMLIKISPTQLCIYSGTIHSNSLQNIECMCPLTKQPHF